MWSKCLGLAIIFVMVISGCTTENPIENPIYNEINRSSLINLPRSIKAEVGLIYSASNIINGTKGGSVVLDTAYLGSSGPVKIYAKIKFYSNAFSGTHPVTMMIDNVSGVVSFDPPSVFARPAYFDMSIEGLNLNGVDEINVAFVYINPNGHFESVSCKEMIIDVPGKRFEIKDAELHHFSRYGWAR